MSTVFIIRIGIALLIAAVLFMQSRGLQAQPHRKRAFQLGAAALLAFVGFNVLLGLGATLGFFEGFLALAGIGLFAGAALSLVLSLRSGERSQDRAKIEQAAREFRQEREARQEEKTATAEEKKEA